MDTANTLKPAAPESAIATADSVDEERGNEAISLGERLLLICILCALTIVVLQPIIGGVLSKALMVTRVLLIPFYILWRVPHAVHATSTMLLLVLLLGTGYEGIVKHPSDFLLVFFALVGSVLLYRAGALAAKNRIDGVRWGMLVHSTSLLNWTTLLVLGAMSTGFLDSNPILEAYQKDVDYGLGRFALGNPIEVPFVVSALLYAGLRNAPSNKHYLGAVTLNLVTALISQSRVVVLVAIFIFLDEWWRSSYRVRLVSFIMALVALVASWGLVLPTLVSIVERFSGNDAGSMNDRTFLLTTVLDAITPLSLLIGKGLTSAADLIQSVDGNYRTVEATWLQLQFEIGIVGMLLMVWTMHKQLGITSSQLAWPGVIALLLWVQILLLLPVNDMMPLAFFALGALLIRRPPPRANY